MKMSVIKRPTTVRFEWEAKDIFQPMKWIYSDQFFMDGVNDVAFNLGLRANNTGYIDVRVMKGNLELADATVEITSKDGPWKREIKVAKWKNLCVINDFMKKPVTYEEVYINGHYSYVYTVNIMCKILWNGFIDDERITRMDDTNLFEDLRKFHKSQLFSDVTLTIEGHDLPAHKIILAAHSPVFAKMLTADTRELKNRIIEITNIKAESLADMLTFFYTGRTKGAENVNNALQMLEVANIYQVNKLKSVCEATLLRLMTVDNVLRIVDAADDFNAIRLREDALTFMANNKDKIVELPSFKTLFFKKVELMYDFMCSHESKRMKLTVE
ncbi:uncharacterized protein LOC103572081 [Microplitis demolitor]|uniref:uncharacterized protein LOC103572081 n=1 Tax=Microplitis demolitor TaxID=69319 RepID=UPI0004CD56F1|nr:uncharacterized protein LOC103572081 [Microplitis demolitor]